MGSGPWSLLTRYGLAAVLTALAILATLEKSKDLPLRWNAQAYMARILQKCGKPAEAEQMYEAALVERPAGEG